MEKKWYMIDKGHKDAIGDMIEWAIHSIVCCSLDISEIEEIVSPIVLKNFYQGGAHACQYRIANEVMNRCDGEPFLPIDEQKEICNETWVLLIDNFVQSGASKNLKSVQ